MIYLFLINLFIYRIVYFLIIYLSVQLDTYSPLWYTFTNILWKVETFVRMLQYFVEFVCPNVENSIFCVILLTWSNVWWNVYMNYQWTNLMFILLVCCKPHISCTRVWNMCDHIPFYLQIYIGFCYTSTCIDSASEYVVLQSSHSIMWAI